MDGSIELIKAISSLWPLFLLLVILIISIIFRTQIQNILDNRNLKVKTKNAEVSLSSEPILSESTAQPENSEESIEVD